MKKIKKPLSILLAVLMVISVFIAVPMTASALTIDDVQSLLSSMEAKINDYYAQGDMDHAGALMNYYDWLDAELEYADGQITPELESAYNEAYEYFMAGVSYPDVNNVYRATNGWVNVAVSDLQIGDVLVTSDTLSVRKGDCDIVLVGGTYCEEDNLSRTYPNNVTLGNDLSFLFGGNYARIIDADNAKNYDPVYNNALGNAYMVIGKENGTVYLAGYYFTIYTVTWKNGETTLKTDTVDKDAIPAYDGNTPVKDENEQYTYTFTGWTDSSNTFYSKDSALPAASKDETYTATYSETLRSYTITWKDGDDNTLKSESVAYGTTPSYTGDTPTKTEDDAYTYEFNNTWSPSVASVTGNATYTAQFTSVPKSAPTPTYTVTWKNGETTLKTDTVEEGNAPAYTGDVPEKAEDENNTYTFSGWTDGTTTYGATDALPAVTGDITYTATYTATFKGILSGNLRKGLVIDEGTPIRFAMTKTEDSWSILGLQVYLDDVLVKSVQTEQLQPTEPDRYYTTTKKCIVDLYSGSGNSYPRVYHTLRLKSLHTVTWKNDDGMTLETDVNVVAGKTPTYNGTTPEKAEDENNTYTFSGWTDGTTTYGATDTLPAVTGDITYTATFTETAKPKNLFPQHSVSLGGDIGVNFYIDPAAAGANEHATVSVDFSWNGQTRTVVAEYDDGKGLFRATCDVVAAEVACDITAVATVNGEKQAQTDTYSVQDYAEAVYNNPTAYDSEKPVQLAALAKALLNYGAMAQTVFVEYMEQPVKAPADIVSTVEKTDFNAITADQIAGEATDLNAIATDLGFKFYTSSVLYLSKNTLRLYFTPNTYQGTMPHEGDFKDKKSNYYYYVEKENIPAAKLDDQQTFTIGGKEFTFSALDYAAAVVNSDMEPEQKDLAKSLYLYNKAANEYFDDAPAPVENVVDLGTLQGDYEAQNNDVLTGVLSGDKKISIADGATITLRDANITLSSSAQYAGITPLGDATILLEETNTVKGGNRNYPGIYVPAGKTLIIDGTGSLNASSHGCGCGIGGGFEKAAGNTVINGGTITATGGEFAAGIGSGQYGSCGNITITGGTITANGGDDAAGIGSGDDGSCGNILITGGTVTANGRYTAAGIGSGYEATCGNITIADTVTQVTATKGKYSPNSIGAGDDGTCGTVTIAPGANVIQN